MTYGTTVVVILINKLLKRVIIYKGIPFLIEQIRSRQWSETMSLTLLTNFPRRRRPLVSPAHPLSAAALSATAQRSLYKHRTMAGVLTGNPGNFIFSCMVAASGNLNKVGRFQNNRRMRLSRAEYHQWQCTYNTLSLVPLLTEPSTQYRLG